LNPIIAYSIGILIFLLGTMFFSSVSAAFFALDRETVKKKARSNAGYLSLLNLLDNPIRLITTLSIASTMSTISYFLLSILLTEHILVTLTINPVLFYLINAVFFVLLVLLLGEILPKVLASKHATAISLSTYPIIRICILGFYPLSTLVMLLSKFVDQSTLRLKEMKNISIKGLSHSEIKQLAKQGFEKGELKGTEFHLIENIIDFQDQIVRKVMTPRTDILAINTSYGIEDVIDLILEEKLSRIPLYEEDLDQVQGIIYAKDLLKFLHKPIHFTRQDWIKLSHQALFVPETQHLSDLLKTFKKKRIHIAIVVDEYGSTSGLVTLDDILEEITGKLNDVAEASAYPSKKLSNNTYWMDARMPIDDMFEVLGMEQKSLLDDPLLEDIDTLSGLILKLSGSIPQEKETFQYKNLDISIEKVERQRIQSAIIHLNAQPDEAAA
jgi:CBS domain containing-hemolysin-like protein